jgi:hypothetical protein
MNTKEKKLPNRGAVRQILKAGGSINDYGKKAPMQLADLSSNIISARDYGKNARPKGNA